MFARQKNSYELAAKAWGVLVALVLCCAASGLVGCGAQSQGGGSTPTTDTAEERSAQTEGEAEDQGEAPTVEEDAFTWADECLDRRGDVTAFAVAELTGEQLEALLLQQDYAWSERNRMWVKQDGSAALVVNDANGEHLTSEQVAALSEGAAEAATSYRIVTSGYSNAKKAFEALAGKLMEVEDVEITDDGAIGVVHDLLGRRCLVFVNESNDVYLVSVFAEPAVEAGLFDAQLGSSYGTTIESAFKALAGRTVAQPQQ